MDSSEIAKLGEDCCLHGHNNITANTVWSPLTTITGRTPSAVCELSERSLWVSIFLESWSFRTNRSVHFAFFILFRIQIHLVNLSRIDYEVRTFLGYDNKWYPLKAVGPNRRRETTAYPPPLSAGLSRRWPAPVLCRSSLLFLSCTPSISSVSRL